MMIAYLRLLSFAINMLSSLQRICTMESAASPNIPTESNTFLSELDSAYSSFVTGNLTMQEQILFIQVLIDLRLQDRYSLDQTCKYFILEGLCQQ